jgi:hypothetical protein
VVIADLSVGFGWIHSTDPKDATMTNKMMSLPTLLRRVRTLICCEIVLIGFSLWLRRCGRPIG